MRFNKVWDRIPIYGHSFGKIYISKYKDDIITMFNLGMNDPSKRMAPSRMILKLKQMYPIQLDLPSESEILQLIQTLIKKVKQGKYLSESSTHGIKMPFSKSIVEIFNFIQGNIKPREAWGEFKLIHPIDNDDNYPEMKMVKSKISKLRYTFKRTGTLPQLPDY